MSKFKVGDVCEVIECIGWTAADVRYMIGLETTIIGPPKMIGFVEPRLRYPCHDPAHPETGAFWLRPENLRLKRPPEKREDLELGDWSLCPWRPAKERV